MPSSQTEEFHNYHVNHAKAHLIEERDLYHEIVFEKDGREQMLILIPSGPTRAVQAAAKAIAESDESDAISIAALVWMKTFTEEQPNYKLGDVGNSTDKRELLIVVTVDRSGKRLTAVNEVIRVRNKVRLEELSLNLPTEMILPDMPAGKSDA